MPLPHVFFGKARARRRALETKGVRDVVGEGGGGGGGIKTDSCRGGRASGTLMVNGGFA